MFGCSVVETVLCQLELGYYLLGLGLEGCSWFSVQLGRGTICVSLGYVWWGWFLGKYKCGSIAINR